jgi:hypothetical protein
MFCHENISSVPTKMFPLLIKIYPCHPEQVRGSHATEDESKDPENISLTMPRQGVLTKICADPKGAFSFPRLSTFGFALPAAKASS